MTDAQKPINYDVDGAEELTPVLMELLNAFPGLPAGDEITFSTLGAESGKAMFPVTGAIIETETQDILGGVRQVCLYPFFVVYRAAGLGEARKAAIKEWLDDLGRWLEGQSIRVNGQESRLERLPELGGSRTLLEIRRQTPAYLDSTAEQVEDWTIYISARYSNEYEN